MLGFAQICADLLRSGILVSFRAPGNSMYPTICDGDVITIMPIETASITIGDIILYRHKSGVSAHRVVRTENKSDSHFQSSVLSPQSSFILRGDAAVVFDDPVTVDQILGKVTRVEREGQRLDPYSFKATIYFKARRMAARLKRFRLSQT